MMRLRRLLAARYGLAGFGEETDDHQGDHRPRPPYPREMSIYGDLGNTRCLAQRIRRHGYEARVHNHDPGATLPDTPHLFMGGGGQDSGQSRVEDDLAAIGTGCAAWPPTGRR